MRVICCLVMVMVMCCLVMLMLMCCLVMVMCCGDGDGDMLFSDGDVLW